MLGFTKLTKRAKIAGLTLLLGSTLLVLGACDDTTKKEALTETPYTNISACDEYLNTMQLCVSQSASKAEQELLANALKHLGEKFSQAEDKPLIEAQCTEALLKIDEHKSAFGCS